MTSRPRLLLPAAFITSLGNNIQLLGAALLLVRAEGSMLDVGYVDAVDLSAPMIDLASRKRPRPNITYRAAGILETSGQYDFVTSSATLHHVEDLPAVLRHIRSLVAVDGCAALADTVSPRPSNPRWWLYGGEVRKLARNLVRRNPHAWEIFRLATGDWLDHRLSDRYLSRAGFEQAYGAVFPQGRFERVGSQHALVWQRM